MIVKNGSKDKLEYRVYQTRSEMGSAAAADISATIKKLFESKDVINMIFAAAPSQNEVLTALVADKSIDFSRINAFHMDEYIGLPADAPQGFGNFLRNAIFDRVGFRSVNFINGAAADSQAECERYSKLLAEMPTDIVCMGIGENGHIAFNDPHVAFFNDSKAVKVVELDHKCRQQQVNDGCFKIIDDVPTHALTLTIPTLMKAAYAFCVVPAATKAEAVTAVINGEIGEKCPATVLRTRDNAILYCDKESGKNIC